MGRSWQLGSRKSCLLGENIAKPYVARQSAGNGASNSYGQDIVSAKKRIEESAAGIRTDPASRMYTTNHYRAAN